MAVYGDLRFLGEAVDSVLAQDFADIELVIVDDGNRQDALFGSIARRDPRIRLVGNPTNLGAAEAANRGIAAASADIIVRLDADDICEPGRVGRLVAALDGDAALGLVGSSVTLIDEAGREVGFQRMPETDAEIRWTILFHNPFYHPAVAFRRSLFERAGGYRVHELVSQDHYLWFDMLPFCRAKNLAEPLVRYRLNSQGLTAQNSRNARQRTHAIREALWSGIGLRYGLYDNALAGDITQWLRGHDLPPERRADAYREILKVFRAFRRSMRATTPADRDAMRQLSGNLFARMLDSPPPERAAQTRLFGAGLSADPAQAIATLARRIAQGRRP